MSNFWEYCLAILLISIPLAVIQVLLKEWFANSRNRGLNVTVQRIMELTQKAMPNHIVQSSARIGNNLTVFVREYSDTERAFAKLNPEE